MPSYDWRSLAAATDYDRRAVAHRPTDPAELGREIRRLRRDGLTARDVAVALRLDLSAVVQALREPVTA